MKKDIKETSSFWLNSIVFYLSAIIPLNLIYIVRLASTYYCKWNLSLTVVLVLLSVLVIIGLLPLFFGEKNYAKLGKSELGNSYKVQSIEDKTSDLYLTQFALFILTSFAIPFTYVWIDFGLLMFVQFCLGVIYIRQKLFYINPVLNLFGFNTYCANLLKIKNNHTYEFFIFSKEKINYFNNRVLKLKHSDLKIITVKGNGTTDEARD